jgi:hypothetical protein
MADDPETNLDPRVLERFTEQARQAVSLAQEEATQMLRHSYVGTEHLLLGLLREQGFAARALKAFDITVERVRAQLVETVGSGEMVISGQIPVTPRAKRVLELALSDAVSQGHSYVGTEHLLLALARENEGAAGRILLACDTNTEAIRDEVTWMLSHPGAGRRAPGPEGRPGRISGSRPRQTCDSDFTGSIRAVTRELRYDIDQVALHALAIGALPASGLPAGVRALDLWSNDRYGAVLFWVDRELDLWGFGHAVLHHVDADRLADGSWQASGRSGSGSYKPAAVLAGKPSGLHRLGGSRRDPIRMTIGIATPDVRTIRLRNKSDARERPPGIEGFFLLGITHQDPITYAYAVTANGHEIADQALLL